LSGLRKCLFFSLANPAASNEEFARCSVQFELYESALHPHSSKPHLNILYQTIS
jgi:hypothetical protein